MTDEALTPEDEEWDFNAAREKLGGQLDGSKAARKTRQKKLKDAVDGRSLRSTGRTEHLNFKAKPIVKELLDTHVGRGRISLWLEEAILAKLKAEGVEIDA
jgi:hypothetical protein